MRLRSFLIWLITPAIIALMSYSVIAHLSDGIIALGESTIQINPYQYNLLSIWEDKVNFGYVSNYLSHLVLYRILFGIFIQFTSSIHPSVVFNFLSYFLSGLFFYLCSYNLIKPKNSLVLLPATIVYTFNSYRIFSGINEINNLLFISLPLFMWSSIRLLTTQRWRYGFIIVVLSFIFSSMGANLPVFTIPYILILIQLVTYLIFFKPDNRKKIILIHFFVIVLVGLVNLFWGLPTILGLLSAYNTSSIKNAMFSAIGSGTFLDHFRFIGSWAWRAGYSSQELYFPFSITFDQPFFFIVSMIIPALVLFGFTQLGNIRNKTRKVLFFSMTAVYPLSFIFLASGKGPFGTIIGFVYKILPYLRIYRDPFAKFTPLFVLSSAILLILTTSHLMKNRKILSWISLFTLTSITVILSFPFIGGKIFPSLRWGGGPVGYKIKIPDYWNDAKKWLESAQINERITLSPYARYGNSDIWPYGVATSDVISEYLVEKPMIIGWDFDKREVNKLIKPIFTLPVNEDKEESGLSRYLGLFNSHRVLQANEYDWRYFNLAPPSKVNDYWKKSGLHQVKTFGFFTTEILNNIDIDPSPGRREYLKSELSNQPALIVYENKIEDFLPLIYVPHQIVFSTASIENLLDYVKSEYWKTPGSVFFNNTEENKHFGEVLPNISTKSDKQICIDNTCSVYSIDNSPVIEYRKITPTKYRLIVHNAKSSFPLIFSQGFNKDWKIYLGDNAYSSINNLTDQYKTFQNEDNLQATKVDLEDFVKQNLISTLGDGTKMPLYQTSFVNNIRKQIIIDTYTVNFVSKNIHGTIQNDNLPDGIFMENWFSKPITLEHMTANGYANAWLVDPLSICKDQKIKCKEQEGRYEFELILEFTPQRIYNLLLVLAIGVVLSAFSILVILNLKKQR